MSISAESLHILNASSSSSSPVATTTTADCVKPFEHQVGDYVKIAYLSILFFIGASINVAAFERLRAAAPMTSRAAAILHRLKTHTNMADLLIIFVFTLSDLCWHTTYDWRAGELMCKLVNFGRMLAFYISSNLVVCIAMNRYLLVFPTCGGHTVGRVKLMLTCAWGAACAASAPQLFIWTIIDTPICKEHISEWRVRTTWRQCCTKWDVIIQKSNGTGNAAFEAEQSSNVYNAINLLFLFWLPVSLVVLFYGLLICRMPHESCRCLSRSTGAQSANASSSHEPQAVAYTGKHATIVVTAASTENTHVSCGGDNNNQQSADAATGAAYRYARSVTIRVSALVSVMYCISFLPYVIMQTHKLVFGHEWYETQALNLDWLNALIVLHSVINPFLYGAFQLAVGAGEYSLPPEDDDDNLNG